MALLGVEGDQPPALGEAFDAEASGLVGEDRDLGGAAIGGCDHA